MSADGSTSWTEGEGSALVPASTASAAVDAHGLITAWSQGAEQLLGHPAGEVLGHPAAELLAQDVSAPATAEEGGGVAEQAHRCLAERTGWAGELTLRHRDGSPRRLGVRAFPAVDRAGDPQWFVVADQEGSPALVEWAFAHSPLTLAIHDLDGRVLRMNAATRRLLGLFGDHVLGELFDDIYQRARTGHKAPSPGAPDPMGEVLRGVGRTGVPIRYEVTGPAPGDRRKELTWAVSMSPVVDPAGRVHGVLTAGFDITEQFLARQRLALLNEASERIGTTLDVIRTAQELVDVAVPRLADFASVDLLEPVPQGGEPPASPPRDGLVVLRRAAHQSAAQEGAPEAVVRLGEVDVYPDYSPPARCLASGEPVLSGLDDPGFVRWVAEFPARAERVRTYGYHSLIAVPLVARGTTLGVAVLLRRRPEGFAPDDVLLAGELSAHAAVCVDNARRYTRERTTALTLQRSLLPQRLHRQIAVNVASRYLPAGTRAGIGGDWFDVIPLSSARVALVVGDVVGHGIHASATMGRLRSAVRTLADVELPPDELLTHLDDLVTRLAEGDALDSAGAVGDIGTTCLYAIYDPVSRHCTLASAGHPPPAVVTPDGDVAFLATSPGPPLGVGGLPFEALDVTLPEGSLLALYTDGLVTSRERDITTGQRLLAGVLRRPADTLEETCDRVLSTLLPDRPQDDAALLIGRTRALGAERVVTLEVAADPAEVARTRKATVEQLDAWGLGAAAFTTELVVSELVTNAIRHARPPIRLRLIRGDTSLICEVSDASSTAPHMRRARSFDEGGRGLMLVAQLFQHWGTRQTPTGKTIWAEHDLSAL